MTRTTRATLLSIAAMVTMLSQTPAVHAVIVKNGSGTVLFADNFENDPLNSEPISPQVGSWTATSTFTHVETAAIDTDPSHPPFTPQGTNYLRLPRYTAGVNPLNPYSPLGSGYMLGANFGTVTSGTISAKFLVYIPSSAIDFVTEFGLSSAASFSGSLAWIDIKPQTDNKIYFNDSINTNLIPGVTYLKNHWQVWQLDYNILAGANNDTWTVTVDGVTSAPLAAVSAGGPGIIHDGATTSLSFLVFRGGGNGDATHSGTAFIDAIPEPASLGLLMAGGLLLLRRRPSRGENNPSLVGSWKGGHRWSGTR